MSQQIPPPMRNDLAINLQRAYECSEEDERAFIRRCHAAETLLKNAQVNPECGCGVGDKPLCGKCVWCQLGARTDRAEAAETVLRELASQVSAGGYNAPEVDAAVFRAKISDGIDTIIRVETTRREAAEKRVTELEQQLESILVTM